MRGRTRIGFEVKRSSAPTITPSMHRALDDLRLDHLYVIHAGPHRAGTELLTQARRLR